MYFDPYATSTASATATKLILNEIRKCDILGLSYIGNIGEIAPNNCTLIHSRYETVKPFSHPLIDPMSPHRINLDVRGYSSINNATGNLEIRNETDFGFQKLRVNLINQSIFDGKESLYTPTMFALEVFANWLSSLIAGRYSLDPETQGKLLVIIGIYYYCLFKGPSAIADERAREQTTLAVSRRLNYRDGEQVLKIAEAIALLDFPEAKYNTTADVFGCIEHLCFAIKEITQSIKLHEFNQASLVTLVGSSWFGPTAKELVSVALEEPTTWIALVAYSIKSDNYKKTRIGETVHRFRREHDSFVKSISRLESLRD